MNSSPKRLMLYLLGAAVLAFVSAPQVRADQVDVFLNVDNEYGTQLLGQSQAQSGGAVIGVTQQHQGTSPSGQFYQMTANALGGTGGTDLFVSSKFASGPDAAALQVDATGNVGIEFFVPANVFSISLGLQATGHGFTTTGNALAFGSATVFLDGFEACGLALNGGTQSCSGTIKVTPGFVAFFSLQTELDTINYAGGSATVDYWGTFVPSMSYYDAQGNLVGGYNFPGAPTVPEPGSVLLFGSGVLGLGGWRLRRRS